MRAVSISSSSSRNLSSVERMSLLDAVDLVQRGGVLAARLHVAQLRLVLLELLLVVGELALGLAPLELGLGQPGPERRDGLDLLLVLAVDLDEVGRDGVALLLALADELDPRLEPVELGEKVAHRDTPDAKSPQMKKGVPAVEHPCVDRAFEIRFRIKSLNLSALVGGSTRIRTGV